MRSLPRLAITIGDPAGLGPEIIDKALRSSTIYRICAPVVIGDCRLLSSYGEKKTAALCAFVHQPSRDTEHVTAGKSSLRTGRASYEYILRAFEMVRAGDADGIVTAPVSKDSITRSGVTFPGHTELLAELSKTDNYAMLMASGKLRTVMVTRHLPLMKTGRALSAREIIRTTKLSYDHLKNDEGIVRPRIAITALNPHAGENGLLGSEERAIIIPAVKQLKKYGIECAGPLPVDSAWLKMKQGYYDLLVVMCHDHAMIGLKCLAPESIVNITIGLPFVRTSPGHGTGFDIAGKNIADPRPMLAAITAAARLVKSRRTNR